MAVLEEVVAEMFKQEQEAPAGYGETSQNRDDLGMVNMQPRQETVYRGEVVDQGVTGMENKFCGDTDYYRLITPYDDDRDDVDDPTIPYEGLDEDDDGDFLDIGPFSAFDAKSIDCSWDAECLQNTEDIDFEFVYALHTFVATVEGQANATKGDTMVLLDDSNSYWWLVRVVKDSSIGECLATTNHFRGFTNSPIC